ncbi:hypothetical protein Tsubulata_029513 [Turnera subulata]|uniref:F-box associated beta-propeller type 1 domain-containing protein n=1 Tax=Turnera subulata TaxID=218843 RepID=A0A9Q0JFR3_9ROSI|nr:hypothetical protein Tsubulata_029513 [Turnera subulata]
MVENADDKYLRHIQQGQYGLFLNGALHWKTLGNGSFKGEKIFAFDLSKEKFYDVAEWTPGFDYGHRSLGVAGEYLCMGVYSRLGGSRKYTVWVMKEYCNLQASWVQFITYYSPFDKNIAGGYIDYVCDFMPQSVKDGGYMILQYSKGDVDVLKWNNDLEESDTGEELYFKNIQFFRRNGAATPYTEALTSPYGIVFEPVSSVN